MSIGVIVGFTAIIVIFIYGIWCARRSNSILESCKGYFGKFGAAMYANSLIVLWVVPIVGVVSLILGLIAGEITVTKIGEKEIGSTLGILIGFVIIILYKNYFEKKLLRLGGEENYKELKKLAWIAGNGRIFMISTIIVGVTMATVGLTYSASYYDKTINVSGREVRVHDNGNRTFTDVEGNKYYTDRGGNIYRR